MATTRLNQRMFRSSVADDVGPAQVCTGFQTASRTTTGFGIRPSLKKRSATPCWVATMSSVMGPTANDERLAATVWMSRGIPVIALNDFATSSRCDSAHLAVEDVTSMICCRTGPWLFAKSRLAIYTVLVLVNW